MKHAANQLDTTTSPISDAHQQDHAARATRTITGQLYRHRRGRGMVFRAEPPAPPPEPVRRPARVAQMVALAHRLEAAIASGQFKDRAELARTVGLTRARITQIMDLVLLAPDIQEEVLEMEAVDGAEPMSVRALQAVAGALTWAEQQAAWQRMRTKKLPRTHR